MFTRRMMTILLAAGFVAAGTAVAAPQFLAARAEEQKTLTAENASLFLPEEYEQYLDLDNPSHVAMSEHYVAVADGMTLYVYDREAGKYSSHAHGGDTSIYMAQFTEDERLFFSDVGHLYEYDFATDSAKIIDNVSCNTFFIDGYDLYVASASGSTAALRHYYIGLSDGETTVTGERLMKQMTSNSPLRLSCEDGLLYCIVDDTSVVTFDVKSLEQVGGYTYLNNLQGNVTGLQFVCAYKSALYYTVNNPSTVGNPNYIYPNGLYRSAAGEGATCLKKGDGFTAIITYGGKLYAVQNAEVHELSLAADGSEITFGDYEISAASASPDRIANASDIARAKNLLVTADTDNGRVSVFDLSTGNVSSITAPEGTVNFTPSHVATDGKLIAFSSGSTVWTYEYGSTEAPVPVATEDEVKGLACVYGVCYYATQHRLGNASTGDWRSAGSLNPAALTADLYGNLYVAESNGNVTLFADGNRYLDVNDGGEPVKCKLPSGFTSLRSDFVGNLYCLADDTLYMNGEPYATWSVTSEDYFVYLDGKAPSAPRAFALGFEDDEIYFCFGNYVIKSDAGALAFPALNTLDASGVYEEVFAPKDGEELALYDVSAGAIGIRVALSEMTEEDAYLPYADYSRTEASARGVLLTDLEISGAPYHLIALYEDHRYTVEIFRADACTLVEPKSDYWTERSGRMYIASEVSAYYFPCLVPALAEQKLERGTPVTLLATVSAENGVGYDFAYVEYETNARSVVRGYVPLATLSSVPPHATAGDDYFFGWLKKTEGGVTFLDEHGDDYVIEERTYMRFTDNGDGTYTAHYTAEDGTVYTALVTPNMFERGESDAWRIALIIILSVLALVIIGAYIYLLPWEKKKKSKKKS